MMELCIKRFDELTLSELYAILKLRSEVFVVEQNCAYNDPDGRDEAALHLFLRDTEGLQAYLRVMDKDDAHEYVSIGRVLAVRRRCGLASRLLQAGIDAAKSRFGARQVYLEAQTYAKGLYEKQGFRQISEEFLEDGIPHVKMLLDL